jgi:hypothetical protein
MAITVSLALTNPTSARANATLNGVLTLTNNGSNTIEVMAIQLTEASAMGSQVGGPYFLTPNADVGVGPTITTSSTAHYPFSVTIASPNMPGAAPTAPDALHIATRPVPNSWARFECNVLTYDATAGENVVGTATLNFPVVSGVATYPTPQGGAMQFNSGGDAVNFFFL